MTSLYKFEVVCDESTGKVIHQEEMRVDMTLIYYKNWFDLTWKMIYHTLKHPQTYNMFIKGEKPPPSPAEEYINYLYTVHTNVTPQIQFTIKSFVDEDGYWLRYKRIWRDGREEVLGSMGIEGDVV